MANPGPVVSVFWTDEELDSNVILDGVVCLVDSYNILNYLVNKETSSDVTMQISYADRIILNKTDLVSEKRVRVIAFLVNL